MHKKLLILIFVFTSSFALAGPEENASARINGITQFLVDRANESYFYIFEKKMKDNTKFGCYFPETFSYIKDGDLKALIKTKDIWQETMDRDFEILQARVVAHGFNGAVNLNKIAMTATNDYANLLRYLTIKIDNETYQLNFIPLNASQDVKNIINGFYTDFNALRDNLLQFDNDLKEYENICSYTRPTNDELRAEIKKLEASYHNLDNWIKHIQKHKSRIKVDQDAIEADCKQNSESAVCDIHDRVFENLVPKIKESLEKPMVKAVAYLVVLDKYIENIQNRKSYTGKVVEAFKVIKEEKLEDKEQIQKFKRYALFIAQVADSTSPDQVDGLLREYALPVTSFIAKREAGENHLMVTSYLGYAAGKVVNDDNIDSDNLSGFYAPIGLEYTRGLHNGGSLSVMLSPVDFGYPVSLKLNGLEEDIELDEIAAPSISLAYGIKDYPVNIGIAFQKGKRYATQNQEEKRLLLFIAFDMPLFAF